MLAFILAFFILALLDYIWLGKIMSGFYLREIGDLSLTNASGHFAPRLWAAVFVYLCLALAVSLFVIRKSDSPMHALFYGGVIGFIIYGVYDFTNAAILKTWPLKVVLVDVAWGVVVCGLTSWLVYQALQSVN